MTPRQLLGCAIFFCSFQAWPVWSQEAILPQGDPRVRAEDAAAQKETRDSRMKQQGQGSNYRVDGERPQSAGKPAPSLEPRKTTSLAKTPALRIRR